MLRERIARWREAREARAYAHAASSLLENETDAEKADQLRQELEWALVYAESVNPLTISGKEPAPGPLNPLMW